MLLGINSNQSQITVSKSQLPGFKGLKLLRGCPKLEERSLDKILARQYLVKARLKKFAQYVKEFRKPINMREMYFRDKGVNPNASDAGNMLAKEAQIVSNQQDSLGFCFLGVKKALQRANIAKEADLPIGSAYQSLNFFRTNTNKFKEIHGIKVNELSSKLKAGDIVLFTKKGEHGHICVASGKGQAYSDHVGTFNWSNYNGGKNSGVEFYIFRPLQGKVFKG